MEFTPATILGFAAVICACRYGVVLACRALHRAGQFARANNALGAKGYPRARSERELPDLNDKLEAVLCLLPSRAELEAQAIPGVDCDSAGSVARFALALQAEMNPRSMVGLGRSAILASRELASAKMLQLAWLVLGVASLPAALFWASERDSFLFIGMVAWLRFGAGSNRIELSEEASRLSRRPGSASEKPDRDHGSSANA